mgnify:CR=1 FL=1
MKNFFKHLKKQLYLRHTVVAIYGLFICGHVISALGLLVPLTAHAEDDSIKPVSSLAAKADLKQQATSALPKQVRLIFQSDDTGLSNEQRKKMMAFIQYMRQHNQSKAKGYTFIVHSFFGPDGQNRWLAQERLREVRGLLRQQDVNVRQTNVTEIYLQSNNEQYIQILPTY